MMAQFIPPEISNVIDCALSKLPQDVLHGEVLDFGCGRGVMGGRLVETARHVVFLDVAETMLVELSASLGERGYANFSLCRDLTTVRKCRFDLINFFLSLHHVDDWRRVLETASGMLTENGVIAITELMPAARKFHREKVPHDGFDPMTLLGELGRILGGMVPLTAFELPAIAKEGCQYGMFLVIAGGHLLPPDGNSFKCPEQQRIDLRNVEK